MKNFIEFTKSFFDFPGIKAEFTADWPGVVFAYIPEVAAYCIFEEIVQLQQYCQENKFKIPPFVYCGIAVQFPRIKLEEVLQVTILDSRIRLNSLIGRPSLLMAIDNFSSANKSVYFYDISPLKIWILEEQLIHSLDYQAEILKSFPKLRSPISVQFHEAIDVFEVCFKKIESTRTPLIQKRPLAFAEVSGFELLRRLLVLKGFSPIFDSEVFVGLPKLEKAYLNFAKANNRIKND